MLKYFIMQLEVAMQYFKHKIFEHEKDIAFGNNLKQ